MLFLNVKVAQFDRIGVPRKIQKKKANKHFQQHPTTTSHHHTTLMADVQSEGLRQLERAERLIEVGTGPRSQRTAVALAELKVGDRLGGSQFDPVVRA